MIAKLEICDEASTKSLKDNTLLKCAELVSANSYKAHKLFKKFLAHEEKNIIITLQKYPKLFIEYIHQLEKTHSKDCKLCNICFKIKTKKGKIAKSLSNLKLLIK